MPCREWTGWRVIICGESRALGVAGWAEEAWGAVRWKARQSRSRLMLSESERSCHVFWQLTRWVWILQHKAGTMFCVCEWVCVCCVCVCVLLLHTFTGKCAPGLFFALTLLPCAVTSLPRNLLSLSHTHPPSLSPSFFSFVFLHLSTSRSLPTLKIIIKYIKQRTYIFWNCFRSATEREGGGETEKKSIFSNPVALNERGQTLSKGNISTFN